MCLGIPGQVVEVYDKDALRMGKVSFSGIGKEVCLAYTPEVQVGDYVIVHVGFAISVVDEAEAREIFGYLRAIGEAEEASDGFPLDLPDLPDPSNPSNPSERGGER